MITNGKVSYRTPSPFEAPATNVEFVFTVAEGTDAEETAQAALAAARRVAEGMGKAATKADTKPAAKPRKAAASKAKKTEEPATEEDKPKADTKGGVVAPDDETPAGMSAANEISDAELQEAARKHAGRLTGRVVKQIMENDFDAKQLSGIDKARRAEFIEKLEATEAE